MNYIKLLVLFLLPLLPTFCPCSHKLLLKKTDIKNILAVQNGNDGQINHTTSCNGNDNGSFMRKIIVLTEDEKPLDDIEALLFPYFKGNGEDGLHLALSLDGYTWTELNDGTSVMAPAVGNKLLRDPSIVKGKDGRYHMVYTCGWYDKGFGYASTDDFRHWSEQQFIPVMEHEPTAKNVWAPEIFYESNNETYYIIWSTTIPGRFPETDASSEDGNNHRMYYTTTKDFKTFSDAALFYDKGFNVIDGFIFKFQGKYNLFLKDETLNPAQKNIRIAMADKPEGPYSFPSEPITGDYWAEGPSIFEKDGYVFIYFDKYKKGEYGALRSNDLIQWEDISDKIELPEGIRHGSILSVPLNLIQNLN